MGEQSPLRCAWVAERWSTAVALLQESAPWLREADVALSVHGAPDLPEDVLRALGATPHALAPPIGPIPVRAAALALQVEAQWADDAPDWVHAVGEAPALALGATAHLFPERRVLAHVGDPTVRLEDAVWPAPVAAGAHAVVRWCALGVERWLVQGVAQRAAWKAAGVPEDRLVVLAVPPGCAARLGDGVLGRGGRVRAAAGLEQARFVLRIDVDSDQIATLPAHVSALDRMAARHAASWLVVTSASLADEVRQQWPRAGVIVRGTHKEADLADAAELYVDAIPGLLAPRRAVEACLERLPVAGALWAAGFPGAEDMGAHVEKEQDLDQAVSALLDDVRSLSIQGARARAWAQRSFSPESCRRALVGLWMPRTAVMAPSDDEDTPAPGRRELVGSAPEGA